MQNFEEESSLLKEYAKSIIRWSQSSSIAAYFLGNSCCADEMSAIMGPSYDAERLGISHASSPTHADLLIVGGVITPAMVDEIKEVYTEIPDPKFVIAFGACAAAGGPFSDSAGLIRASQLFKVDFTVPGCPPRPEALLYAVLQLKERLRSILW